MAQRKKKAAKRTRKKKAPEVEVTHFGSAPSKPDRINFDAQRLGVYREFVRAVPEPIHIHDDNGLFTRGQTIDFMQNEARNHNKRLREALDRLRSKLELIDSLDPDCQPIQPKRLSGAFTVTVNSTTWKPLND